MKIEMRLLTTEKAEIDLNGVITRYAWEDEVSAKSFQKDLKALGAVTEITLNVNSEGGDVFQGNAIMEMLRAHPAKVHSNVLLAASMAGIIVVGASDTVSISESGFFMLHNASGWAQGDARELRKRADLMESITTNAINAYVKKSGQSRKKITQMFDDETWVTASEAVELKFADEVTEYVDLAASISPDIASEWKSTPEPLLTLVGAAVVDEAKVSRPVAAINPTPSKEVPMDLAKLKAEHPELVSQIVTESIEAVQASASSDTDEKVAAERERIVAIQEAALPGQEELVQKAINEGTGAGDFALAQVKSIKAANGKVAADMLGDLEPIPGQPAKEKADEPKLKSIGDIDAGDVLARVNASYGGAK